MKKLSISFFLFLVAACACAAELNIYASGLRVNGVDENNHVTISYFLNAPATALQFQLLNASTDAVVTTVAITDAAALTKGQHDNVEINLHDALAGTYKWALQATGAANNTLTEVSRTESYYATRGVAVNYYPETDGFGKVYVSDCTTGPSTASGQSVTRSKGIYVYDAGLHCLNSSSTTGITSADWTTAGGGSNATTAPNRISVGEDGNLYISVSQTETGKKTGVWILDGSDNTTLQQLIDGGTPYGNCVVGTGVNRILYTLDAISYSGGYIGNMLKFPFGNTIPYTAAGETFRTATQINTGNAHCSLASDHHGGFWASQNRSSDAPGLSILYHLTSAGVKNYNSSDAKLGLTDSRRGGMAVNKDGSLVAIASNFGKSIEVFSVVYDGESPTLTKAYTVTYRNSNGNTDGLAFDYANNLYIVSSQTELMHIYAPVNVTNTCTTPAASSRTITLAQLVTVVPVTGVSLNETSAGLYKGEELQLTATVAPDDASDKTIESWSSSDESVATVSSSGLVTAIAPGTATITVTTHDQTKTATCAITVSLKPAMSGTYKVGGTDPDFATLYAAISDLTDRGIAGDITFLICGNLNETENIGLTNNTEYSITIRPDTDEDRTITFSKSSDNGGPSGAFIIGAPFGIKNMTAVATKNITIDGIASPSATHKMTIQVSSSFGSNAGPVVFYGAITNSTIRNCRLIDNIASGTGRANCLCIRATASGTPDGIVVENNYMQTTGVGNACAIYIRGDNNTANPPANTIIRGNEIKTLRDAILMQYCKNINIEGNIIRTTGCNGVNATVISSYTGGADQTSGDIIIRNNRFLDIITNNGYDDGTYGVIAINAMSNGNWVIENNLFTGFDCKTATRKGNLIGIKTGASPSSIKIRHNTFYMPAFTKAHASSALLSTTPVSMIYVAGGTPVIQNNIFVSQETACVNSIIRGALNSNFQGNVIYSAGGKGVIVDGGAAAATFDKLADGYKTGNVNQLVEFVDGYKLAPAYVNAYNLGVSRLEDLTTDIEGNARYEFTHAGCYEASDIMASIVHVESVTMSPTTATIAVGKKLQLAATLTPVENSFPDITWSSSNTSVATVSAAGLVTAVANGTATITAAADGKEASCVVEVATPTAHILPYELRRTLNTNEQNYTFSFKSNIPATAGRIVFYQDAAVVGDYEISTPIIAGANEVVIAIENLPQVSGAMTWAVELTGAASKVTGDITPSGDFNVYSPRGIAVDNSPESPNFGHIYFTQPINGLSGGLTTRTKTQSGGLFVYDPLFTELNPTNSGIKFGLGDAFFAEENYNHFRRVQVDDAGYVYVNTETAILKASPDNLNASTDITDGVTGWTKDITSFCLDGNTIYTYTVSSTHIYKIVNGAATELTPSGSKYANGFASLWKDGHGGFWIVQNRAKLDAYNMISHINAAGTIDYEVNQSSNETIFGSEKAAAYRGAMAINREGNLMALGTQGHILFFDIAYNGSGVPTLTKKDFKLENVCGTSNDGLAFDYAGNLYSVNSSTELFYGFTYPVAENKTLVPASSSLTVETVIPTPTLILDETVTDNTTQINALDDQTVNATIRRTFVADGDWYTFVLPFDLTATQCAAAFGAGYKLSQLTSSEWTIQDEELALHFTSVTEMEAGVPYLFKPAADITSDIIINDVTVNAKLPAQETQLVNMVGLYDKSDILVNDNNYYLEANNLLYPYIATTSTKGLRAYFFFHLTSGSPKPGIRARAVFDRNTTTDLIVPNQPNNVKKIIENGQLIIIREGVRYDARGQRL